MSQKTLLVYGYGEKFKNRYGTALVNSGFNIQIAEDHPPSEVNVYLISDLDGEVTTLPDERIDKKKLLYIYSKSKTHPEIETHSSHTIDVTPEALLFMLGDIVHDVASKRKNQRYLTPIPVHFRAHPSISDPFPAINRSVLVNLSLGGAYIRSLNPPQINTEMELTINSNTNSQPIVVTGRVLYHLVIDLKKGLVTSTLDRNTAVPSHPGFAVRFDKLEPNLEERLLQLLNKYEKKQIPS